MTDPQPYSPGRKKSLESAAGTAPRHRGAEGFDGSLDGRCAYFFLNDLGDSERFIMRFGQDMVWVRGYGTHWIGGGNGGFGFVRM